MSSQIMSAPRQLPRNGSSISRQMQKEKAQDNDNPIESPRSSSKTRSLSDAPKPSLSPSPALIEAKSTTKDDSAIISSPVTPRRPNFPLRGLSLQMPQKDLRGPLSPKLDQTQTFGSPVLPRRSRGLDFSRACTNLHHSTLAESSPDSSPTISGVRSMHIPRKSIGASSDISNNGSNGLWSAGPSQDRTVLSSSVSSVNMLDSDSNSSDSSDDDLMDRDGEDTILGTPQVLKLGSHFTSGVTNSPGGEWHNNQYSPAAASLLSFQRARLGKHRSRNSSSSGHSSKPSPGPLSPPLMKSVESQGFFTLGLSRRDVQSRRESLSLGTNDLNLESDSEGESESKAVGSNGASGGVRGVIRRAVTRRGNLLPKTKNFARIRAALQEESAPVDSDAKREAEVIHLVRESEPASALTSPNLIPSTGPLDTLDQVLEDEVSLHDGSISEHFPQKTNSFSQQAEKNSGGKKFWNSFDELYRTPPPQLLPTRSSSGVSDDVSLATSSASYTDSNIFRQYEEYRSRSSTPLAAKNATPTAADVTRRVNNKRRRDDDFDPDSFKRRAVSPGLSVQSSPILPQSPVFGDKAWGRPPSKASNPNDRSNSNGSTGGGIKRVGLLGMTETHDGFMNMSIE